MVRFLLPALLAASAFAAGPLFDLSGQLLPPRRASVSLFATKTPFTAATVSDAAGRFAFKKLPADDYTVAVVVAGRGEARRTVEVGPAAAGSHQRVSLTLDLKDSDFEPAAVVPQHSVSVGQLAIPTAALRQYQQAQKDLARRHPDAAVKRLENAVSIAPEFAMAWNELGTIAYQTRKFDRAEECFRQALQQDPGSFEPLVNLGGVLVTVHKLDLAADYNLRAVLIRPNDALANSQLGLTYFELARMDLAQKYLERARQIDPAHFSHPQLLLAEIHLRRGQRREAAAVLEEFLKYHPDWPQAAKMRETIAQLRQ
ncbi:MAG TPA: tetratricopeptide repeat protein [Bryobacteraceae bacterium]|nr:tetratricopeptide repeat protein [Bryobacteraceae bacterium]